LKNGADKMFFKKQQQQPKQTEYTQFAPSSNFGRGVSSIQSASNELFHKAKPFNPLHFLDERKYFLGLDHKTGEPIYLPNKDVVHFLITAPTRSGKGIFFGIKAIETIRQNKGLIVIDPKEDEWLPQIILEELMRQGREEDLIIWNWSSDFSYKVFEFDDYIEATKKLTIMLNLIEVENEAGASHYRKSERIVLKKVMMYFFNAYNYLGIPFKKDIPHLLQFLKYVVSDLTSHINFTIEFNKPKPNITLLKECSKRYFDPQKFTYLEFTEKHLPTLESLLFSLSEFEDVTWRETSSILEALTDGKVIYIKSDMLDESALKFLKFIITDIVAKAKKLKGKANCLVLADEISFYPTPILSSALATIAGFGVTFALAYQDDGQLRDENLKSAIKSNCQTKIYYKSSDIKTLEYIEKLSGKELVSKITKNGNDTTIRQDTQDYLNITKQRALPKSQVAILIQESLSEPLIFDTYPIPVSHPFDWESDNNRYSEMALLKLDKNYTIEEFKESKKEAKNTGVSTETTPTDTIVSVTKFEI
jgi:type IV secretion system protein VirD4